MNQQTSRTIVLPYGYVPRKYQLPAWRAFEGGKKRGVMVWHRRAGKDLFALNYLATQMMERRGLYWHLFPTYNQGRKIVWDGFTKDGRGFLEHFPEELVVKQHNTEMQVELNNGSIYQVVGTDNIDRLVGANPIGCVFSEYSLQDPNAWNMIRPILAENGGWAMFIYTPRGRNHGYDLVKQAEKNPNWFCQVLTVDDTKVVPLEAIEEDRASGMPEELVQQEYWCSFDAPLVGAYYGALLEQARAQKRVLQVPYDPLLPVHTAWDLGIDDSTAIWFFQVYGFEVRVIDYYENSGEGLLHYAKKLKELDYNYGNHYGPHDLEVRELGSGKSRVEIARGMGLKFKVVKMHDVEDGIEQVRNLLPKCWFDETKCERGFNALGQYRKEWDDKRRVFRTQPLHDWTSHAADAFRILAMGMRYRSKYGDKAPQTHAIGSGNDYDPYNSGVDYNG